MVEEIMAVTSIQKNNAGAGTKVKGNGTGWLGEEQDEIVIPNKSESAC